MIKVIADGISINETIQVGNIQYFAGAVIELDDAHAKVYMKHKKVSKYTGEEQVSASRSIADKAEIASLEGVKILKGGKNGTPIGGAYGY
ncbi:MAG: hypothetical protein ATN35_02020 [Epulopiscium sp. Nele67-Bin004]|nr:MAG: hypothetical protein ATN35_02020 [Epulopiscium sp. Nele67-Bin004]